MRRTSSPPPVKLFVGMIASDPAMFSAAGERLKRVYGGIDGESAILPWEVTDYYREEMGEALKRVFLSFASLCAPDGLPSVKNQTNQIEEEFSVMREGRRCRRINLDPGYLEGNKLVLASTKNAAHRIYLADGIYAEVTLLYHHGAFHPLDHTYPDYRWPQTIEFFHGVRRRYLEQLRSGEDARKGEEC